MKNKVDEYVKKLFKKRIFNDGDITDKNESLFIDFIQAINEGGNIAIFNFPFQEKVDEFITSPENIDLIEKIFKEIHKDYPEEIDIISSGSFGNWILELIESGKINFNGNVVVMNGSIRKVKEDRFNEVKVINKRYKDISNKKFVFVDDSYFSGGTRDRIKNFLKPLGSKIIKTYVIYTHNIEDPNIVYSIYSYSEHHDEEIVPVSNYLKIIKDIDLKEHEDEIWDKINSGEISRNRDLIYYIKSLKGFKNEKIMLKYSQFFKP